MNFTKGFAVLLTCGLVACAGGSVDSDVSATDVSETPTENASESENASEPVNEETQASSGTQLEAVGDTLDIPELGRVELVKVLGVDETIETGPFTMSVGKVSIMDVQTNESSKVVFNNQDRVTMASFSTTVENTSPDTFSFHPNQAVMTTNTKEQQQADLFMSEEVGGDFIGEVVKEGNVVFVLESAPEDITEVTFTINPPFNEQFQPVGNEVTLNYSF